MSGKFTMESVATLAWNQWQLWHGIGGNFRAEYAKEGRAPEQPFSGSFNVRAGTDLHRHAVLLAKERGTTLNRVVSEALIRYLQQEGHVL
jgi:predicted HicB family RNase H-like nuclease